MSEQTHQSNETINYQDLELASSLLSEAARLAQASADEGLDYMTGFIHGGFDQLNVAEQNSAAPITIDTARAALMGAASETGVMQLMTEKLLSDGRLSESVADLINNSVADRAHMLASGVQGQELAQWDVEQAGRLLWSEADQQLEPYDKAVKDAYAAGLVAQHTYQETGYDPSTARAAFQSNAVA